MFVNRRINDRYKTPPYDGRAILLKVDKSFLHPDVHNCWRQVLTGDFRIHTVSGRHLTILRPPYVAEVGEVLSEALQRTMPDA
jgi:thioesterase domain-containing protein